VIVGIIDLGINNLTSVQRAFSVPLKPSDSLVVIEADPKINRPDLIILPGLGKFGAGMLALNERNLVEKIKSWTSQGTKVVGICLGMQLLGTSSEESPGVSGLDLIRARIERLPGDQGERIPHTGWAGTKISDRSRYFSELGSQGDFYFVHSFHLVPESEKEVLSRTQFGDYNFVSSVFSEKILGLQFHPEKSGNKGKKLVSEIIEWASDEN
jgi:imidazole glycerol-phosphate synthase subunit HisH